MEDINSKILREGYGLKLLQGTRTRTGFVCKTNDGMKEIKKNNTNEQNIIFENDVKNHLILKGFDKVNPFLNSIDGKSFFDIDGEFYTVENYFPFEEADLKDESCIIDSVKILAEFGNSSVGFSSIIKKKNIDISIIYKKRLKELLKIKKDMDKKGKYTSFDIIILKNFNMIMDNINTAINIIDNSDYKNVMEKAQREKTLCHNSFKGKNIHLLENGGVIITGLNKCTYDASITDLADFLRRYMKNEDCNCEIANKIIEEYNNIRNVSKSDLKVVYGMITFPNKFLKLCNEYYNKRRVCISGAMLERFEKCVDDTKRSQDIIKNLKII